MIKTDCINILIYIFVFLYLETTLIEAPNLTDAHQAFIIGSTIFPCIFGM